MNFYTILESKGKIIFLSIVALCAVSVAGTSIAAINAEVGAPPITDITNFEDFTDSDIGVTPPPYITSSGFTFDCESCSFSNYSGGLDGNALYQNGGSTSMTSVMLTSGENFAAVSMMIGNGWGPDDPQQVWVRAYNDGSPVISFVFPDTPLAATITVWADSGSIFDEVRVQAYREVDSINEDEAQYGAISIDDVTAGTAGSQPPVGPVASIPTLSTWAIILLTALLGLVASSRRRVRD